MTSQWPGARTVLDVVTSVALLTAAVALIAKTVSTQPSGQPTVAIPSSPVSVAGAAWRGAADAPAVLVVFSDFECPFCQRFTRDVLPELERRYIATKKLAFVFRHLPLKIHE